MIDSSALEIKYEKFILPNGIECILYKRSEIHSVNIRVKVRVGSLDEDSNNNGISHFIEHVVHDGTEKLKTWEDLDKYLNDHAGSANAYTSFDHTQYHGTFPYQYLENAIFYFSELVLHPLLLKKDVDKERTIILDEKRRSEDNVNLLLYRNFRKMRFATNDDSYSYDVIGTKENLERFERSDLQKHYEDYYLPENIEVYIVGNMDVDSAKKYLEKYFYEPIKTKTFGAKKNRIFKTKYPEYSGFQVSAVKKLDLDQYYMTFSFPGFSYTDYSFLDREKIAFLTQMTATSGYAQSVLWKRLREELNLVYGVSAFTYEMFTRSIFGISLSFNKDNLSQILTEVKSGLNKIKGKEITNNVFEARKKYLLDTQLMELDYPNNILEWIVDYEEDLKEKGSALTLSEYLEMVSATKFEDVLETSSQIFNWNNLNIGIVSVEDKTDIESKLKDLWKSI